MAKGFVCDVTKRLVEGMAAREIEIPVMEGLTLVVQPLKVLENKNRIVADLSPEVVEEIRKAVQGLKAKFEKAAKPV
jgi:hypothetical protein